MHQRRKPVPGWVRRRHWWRRVLHCGDEFPADYHRGDTRAGHRSACVLLLKFAFNCHDRARSSLRQVEKRGRRLRDLLGWVYCPVDSDYLGLRNGRRGWRRFTFWSSRRIAFWDVPQSESDVNDLSWHLRRFYSRLTNNLHNRRAAHELHRGIAGQRPYIPD